MDYSSKISSILPKGGFHYKLGNFYFEPSYFQVGLIIFLIFLLLLSLARVRHLFVSWSLGKHSVAIFVWGFIVALIVEGFFILAGRTMFTEILGWKNPPKPIAHLLDLGRNRLVYVLGESTEIKISQAKESSVNELIKIFFSLSTEEKQRVKAEICKP